jgi:formate dehydrogenase subunit gamma
MASRRRLRIARFSRTERIAHWLLASTFFVMLGSGLALYLPALSDTIARPTAKAWHLWSAAILGIGIVVIVALGDRRALGKTVRDLERLDGDDAEWLTGGPKRFVTGDAPPPQGRFNAGQKLNAAITLGLMVVMAVTGLLLWYGEQDTRFRFAGSVDIHDWGSWILIILVTGHIYLAVLHPATRHALRGITVGDVDREWAEQHHAKWVAGESPAPPAPPTREPAPRVSRRA